MTNNNDQYNYGQSAPLPSIPQNMEYFRGGKINRPVVEVKSKAAGIAGLILMLLSIILGFGSLIIGYFITKDIPSAGEALLIQANKDAYSLASHIILYGLIGGVLSGVIGFITCVVAIAANRGRVLGIIGLLAILLLGVLIVSFSMFALF